MPLGKVVEMENTLRHGSISPGTHPAQKKPVTQRRQNDAILLPAFRNEVKKMPPDQQMLLPAHVCRPFLNIDLPSLRLSNCASSKPKSRP